MNLSPQPGDRWTRPNKNHDIIVVKVGKMVDLESCTKQPYEQVTLEKFIELAKATLANGGTLHRGDKTWTLKDEIEQFEV